MARTGSWEAWGEGMRRAVESGQTFRAYQPPLPPAGSYDPALDAQRAAAARGLLDLTQDVGTANLRGTVDYGLQRDDIGRASTRGVEDLNSQQDGLERSFGRNMTDLGTARTRTGEDYTRNVQMLTRSYQQLGNRQGQQMRATGVAGGGAALQAARKRAENMALDKQPMDTNLDRFNADNTLAQQRLGQDRQVGLNAIGRSRGRLGEDTDLAYGKLALTSAPPGAQGPFGGREFQDRTTQLTRAQREASAFGLDLDAQRLYQAAGAGWVPEEWRR